jgi:hypothetical protein
MKEKVIHQPDGSRYDYNSLVMATYDALENIMRVGTMPDVTNLAGWEFKGCNTTDLALVLGFKKFKKGFYQDDSKDISQQQISGYNVKIAQNGLGEAWIDIEKRGKSVKHGWYDVYQVNINEVDNKYFNTLLLNYNSKRNPRLDPSRFLRDYLVQVYPDNKDLYLGKAYVALGLMRVFVSYFILERYNESTL